MEALRELVSKELHERVGKIYYMDQSINFLVEIKTVSDLKDMCQLQVEMWEPAGAAVERLKKLATPSNANASADAGNGSNGEAEPQKYNWGFGDSEPAHRPGSGTPHTRGLACGAATGWTYVEESELGTVVALNVGGKLFTSSYNTFTRVKDSFLAGMLCGRFPVSRDFNGNIFIDRDPKLFRWVLNYLRDETLSPPKDHDKVEALLAEARYFQLPDMERLLQDAWGQQCVLTYYANPPNGLVHTLHVDGPLDVIKGIRSAVSSVIGSEHCSYSLDGTLLTLNLDAAHGGIEMPSHAIGSYNHPHSLLSALLGQGWEVFAQDICGVMFERPPDADARNMSGSKKPPQRSSISSTWESNAVNRALSLTGGLKAPEPEAPAAVAPKSSLVTRYLLRR
eukprot:Tamp_16585.p1 GENE.Tamp_16585~~Tamp_16585.p1  ORF type:complete len:427 (+),score=82.43 Tamp_16585:99-1283(+)